MMWRDIQRQLPWNTFCSRWLQMHATVQWRPNCWPSFAGWQHDSCECHYVLAGRTAWFHWRDTGRSVHHRQSKNISYSTSSDRARQTANRSEHYTVHRAAIHHGEIHRYKYYYILYIYGEIWRLHCCLASMQCPRKMTQDVEQQRVACFAYELYYYSLQRSAQVAWKKSTISLLQVDELFSFFAMFKPVLVTKDLYSLCVKSFDWLYDCKERLS